MRLFHLYNPSIVTVCILCLIQIQTAMIDNCATYPHQQNQQIIGCLQCRSGFYLKQGSCSDCNAVSIGQYPQCKNFVTSSFGSNYVDLTHKQSQQSQYNQSQTMTSADGNDNTIVTTGQQMFDAEQNEQKKIKQKLFFQSILSAAMNEQQPVGLQKTTNALQKIQTSLSASSVQKAPIQSKEQQAKIQSKEQTQLKVPQNKKQTLPIQSNEKTQNKTAQTQKTQQKTAVPIYDLQRVDLKNCKQLQAQSSKCAQCYIGYEVDQDGGCKLKVDLLMKANQNDKNCLIFSQIRKICIQCDKQMVLDPKGRCVENSIINKNEGGAIILKDNSLDAKTQKAVNLQVKQQVKQQSKEDHKKDEGALFKPKHVDDMISLWSFSNQPLTLTLTLSDASSQIHELKIVTSPVPQNNKPTQISIDVDNTITKVTVKAQKDPNTEGEGCMQWVDKSCVVCKQGYFMNVLVNECLKISPYVELSKSSSTSNTKSSPSPSLSLSSSSSAQTMLSADSVKQNNGDGKQNKNTNMLTDNGKQKIEDMISLKVGNEIINVAIPNESVTQTSNPQNTNVANSVHTNINKPSNETSAPAINVIKNESTIKNNDIIANTNLSIQSAKAHIQNNTQSIAKDIISNPKPDTTINTANTIANTKNTAKTVAQNSTSEMTATQSNILPSPATGSNQTKSEIVSITINATQRKVSDLQAKAGTGVVIQKCYKYKQSSQEQCVQCDPGFYLYTGRCYDPVKYRALIKSRIISTSQIGSNTAGSATSSTP